MSSPTSPAGRSARDHEREVALDAGSRSRSPVTHVARGRARRARPAAPRRTRRAPPGRRTQRGAPGGARRRDRAPSARAPPGTCADCGGRATRDGRRRRGPGWLDQRTPRRRPGAATSSSTRPLASATSQARATARPARRMRSRPASTKAEASASRSGRPSTRAWIGADLEDRDIGPPLALVVDEHAEQPGQERATQLRVVER